MEKSDLNKSVKKENQLDKKVTVNSAVELFQKLDEKSQKAILDFMKELIHSTNK